MQSFLCMLLAVSIVAISCKDIKREEEFDALSFLESTGYLDDIDDNNRYHAPDNVKQALKEFQQFYGLKVTGRMDKTTIDKMKQPRCGVPDVVKPSLRPENQEDAPIPYAVDPKGSKWHKKDLTYKFQSFTPQLPEDVQRKQIAEALKLWTDVTPLTIKPGTGRVEIEVRFARRKHANNSLAYVDCATDHAFDGPGGVIAHSFTPGYPIISGDIHFDEDETWLAKPGKGVHLKSIAAHEIGHALGLEHSHDPNAVMYSSYHGEVTHLTADDIKGIQSLYGDNKRSICNITFDATERVHDGHQFAFVGADLYDMTDNGVRLKGPIEDFYKGAPSIPDAVIYDGANGKTYILKGTQFWRYTKFQPDAENPQTLQSEFHNLDAATMRRGLVYTFKKSYSRVYSGFPDSPKHVIVKLTHGPGTRLDAMLNGADGHLYAFVDQWFQDYTHHAAHGRNPIIEVAANRGYPKSMRRKWLGLGC